MSAFLGVRLWQGGELYFNPESLQGFGVADTTGAAGYPNGEAQKSNFPYPRFNVSRLFLRQEIGLGQARSRLHRHAAAHAAGSELPRELVAEEIALEHGHLIGDPVELGRLVLDRNPD